MRSFLLQRRRSSILAIENLNNVNLCRRRSSLLLEPADTRVHHSPPTTSISTSSEATAQLSHLPPKSTDRSNANDHCSTPYIFLNNGTALENHEGNNNNNNYNIFDNEGEKNKKNPKVLNYVLKNSCRRMSVQFGTMVADDSLRRFVVIVILMGFIILFAVVYSCYKMILKQLHQIQ